MYINRDSIYSQRNKISLQVKSLFKGDIYSAAKYILQMTVWQIKTYHLYFSKNVIYLAPTNKSLSHYAHSHTHTNECITWNTQVKRINLPSHVQAKVCGAHDLRHFISDRYTMVRPRSLSRTGSIPNGALSGSDT